MATSEKSLIAPEEIKPGIPIKKSTLGMIAVLVAVGTFTSAMLMQGGSKQVSNEPSAAKAVVSSTEAGRSSTIDEEQRQAGNRVGTPADQATQNAVRTANDPLTNPLPATVRRDNPDAALGERALVKITGVTQGPAGSPQGTGRGTPVAGAPAGGVASSGAVTGNGRGGTPERDVEIEAQARGAKALMHDFDAPAAGASPTAADASSLLPAGLDQLLKQTQQAGQTLPNQAPSAGLQPTIDAAMAQLKAATNAPGANAANRTWLNEYAGEKAVKPAYETIKSYATNSRYTLHQGKVIPATLGRKVNSDLPGEITAYTTVDVYDSLGNGALLIPKGSVLVGRYNNEIKLGQERLLFAFQRLILPNGRSFDLPAAQGTDLSGASGVGGNVNNHFFKMFASSFLVAWASDKVAQPQNVTVIGGSSGTTSPAGQILVDVGKSILDRNKNIPPTITIDQGARINVEVARDMEFPGPYLRSRN